MTDWIDAPGAPGLSPTWTSSAKTGVGTALSDLSRVSFTISHGIVNEVYFPRIDEACTRDLGLIVTDDHGYFSEEKRDTTSTVTQIAHGVPGYCIRNESRDGRYRIEKRIIADPDRDVLLQQITVTSFDGKALRVFALLAPHLVNAGQHNTAWIETLKGWTLPFASGRGSTVTLAASRPFLGLSVGFSGASDGYRTLQQHGSLAERYTRARDGNVAIMAELDMSVGPVIVLALGFGHNQHEAGNRARASLVDEYPAIERKFVAGWTQWQKTLRPLDRPAGADGLNPYRISTAVLRTHEALPFAGGMIASLSIPWGASKGDNDIGGYHLVWPRDLVESALGLLAIGAFDEVRRVIGYLVVTQEGDGRWPQNMWLDGQGYWPGIQLDETAFPILLIGQALQEGALTLDDVRRLWPTVRKAATFVVRHGPATGQDRWEEDPGFSPFTLAVIVAGLVVAADLAVKVGQEGDAAYLLETADLWNDSIERWCYAEGTDLARSAGVEGYYVRISPEMSGACSPLNGTIAIKNRDGGDHVVPAASIVSPDALALVRFGLRAADDPRIRNTVAAIDTLLKVELPQGPLWYRYNEDGYGEKADGAPFDGTGLGRLWPLMASERAHYEVARGDLDEARRLLDTLERSSSDGRLIPEQIWDGADIPERELFRGKPSGSAMPLVWAHAEHVKLLRSLEDGRIFDLPTCVAARYARGNTGSALAVWRLTLQAGHVPTGRHLRVELLRPARVRWTRDGWANWTDLDTTATDFDTFLADLPTGEAQKGTEFAFTMFWTDTGEWDGSNYDVRIV